MARIGKYCSAIVVAVCLPAFLWASYQPVTGSSVTVFATTGGAIPVSGSGLFTVANSTIGVTFVTPYQVFTSSFGTNSSTIAASIISMPNVTIGSALPPGSNQIGTIQLLSGTANIGTVTGSTVGVVNGGTIFQVGNSTTAVIFPSAQAVTGSGLFNVTGSTVGIVGSISNTGFNVNNTPTILISTAGVNGSTIAVVNANGTALNVTGSTVGVVGTLNASIGQSTFGVVNGGSVFSIGNSTIAISNSISVVLSTAGVGGSTTAVVNANGTNLSVVFPSAQSVQGTVTANVSGATIQNSTIGVVGTAPFQVQNSTIAVLFPSAQSVTVSNSGFNINNAPTVIESTAGVNGSTIAVTNAVGTNLSVSVSNTPTVSATQGTSPWVIGNSTEAVVPAAGFFNVTGSTVGIVGSLSATIGQSTFGVVNGGGIFSIGNSTIAISNSISVTSLSTSTVGSSTGNVVNMNGLSISSTSLSNPVYGDGKSQIQTGTNIGQTLVTGIPFGVTVSSYGIAIGTTVARTGAVPLEGVLFSSGSAPNGYLYLCGCEFSNPTSSATVVIESPTGSVASRLPISLSASPVSPQGVWGSCQNPVWRSAAFSNTYIFVKAITVQDTMDFYCLGYYGP